MCVGIKISATDLSTALRNATEVANVLIEKLDTKEALAPVLILYTDGGPEHRTTFLSGQIGMICSQKYLDLDQVLAVRTAPGHSYRNSAEKINCLLNIGLYRIGCMRQQSTDPFFAQSLSRCTSLGDVRKLIEKNSDRNTKLLKECCQPCINLISETFSRLELKDEPSTHKEIIKLFTDVGFEGILKPKDTMTKFSQCPELTQYLSHCTRERTYFVSLKKCGSRDCIICKPPRLSVYPILSLAQMITTKNLVKFLAPKQLKVPYHHLKLPRIMDTRSHSIPLCNTQKTGLTTIAPNHYNHCITLVTNYPECCVHCGSKQRLTSGINEYSTCKTCKVLKKLLPVLKRKRRKNYHYKHNEIVMFLWFLKEFMSVRFGYIINTLSFNIC